MSKKAEENIWGSKTINTFMYLKKASQLLLKEAKENPEGCAYKYMTSMLTSAFFLEAYLNHLGRKKIALEQWDKWERKSSREKLKNLAEQINYSIDYSSRPFKTFQEIFKFRNLLVHGKTGEYTINGVQEIDVEKPTSKQISEAEWKSDKPNWKAMIEPDTAERFFEDATRIIEILHALTGLPQVDLHSFEQSEIRGGLQTKDS
jgi:hypothetical protein